METIRPNANGEFEFIDKDQGCFNLALGNMTMFQIGFIHDTDFFFIGVCGKGAYTFTHFAHWAYVAEKLKLMEGDARNLADFINTQIIVDEFEKQGYYDKSCCKKE